MRKYGRHILGLGVGAILGFGYHYFIGCAKGTCAITSNPYISTAYGAMMGLLFAWPSKQNEDQDPETDEKTSQTVEAADEIK